MSRTTTTERDPSDDPLEVDVIAGRLVISIGVRVLAAAVVARPEAEDPIRITDPLVAAREIATELCREEEDGTTLVHRILDEATFNAWENGADGFATEDETR